MTGTAAGGSDPVLPLERYAEAAAHITHFRRASPSEVIERLGIDADDFEVAQTTWANALAEELERHETALACQLGQVFSATRQRLAREQPTLESIGLRTPEREVRPATEKRAGKPPAVTRLSEEQKKALERLAATADVPEGLTGPALPFTEPGARIPSSMAGEQNPSNPLKGGAAPRAPLAVGVSRAPAEELRQALERLAETTVAPDGPRGHALPFVEVRPQLPFKSPTPPSSSTAPVPREEAVPLTLEQHASLCVELAMNPGQMAETLARYGLTPEAKSLADAYFNKKIAASPEARVAWNQSYKTYQAWLIARGRTTR